MSLFKEKSAFDIPDLKNSAIEKLIKSATQSDSDIVLPQVLGQITDYGTTIPSCAIIITQLLRVFDELGSHTGPVYKALVIMLSCLKCRYQERFIQVARALVPEIQTVLYLSFGAIRPKFRDEIHLMAAAIYDFLMYEVPLPDIGDFSLNGRRKLTHRPAPPPEEYVDVQPVTFAEPRHEEEEKQESEDDELDFDPRAMRASPPPPKPAPEPVYLPPPPMTPLEDIIDFKTVPDAPKQEPAPPQKKELVVKTEKDLVMIAKLRQVTKLQYDETIESC